MKKLFRADCDSQKHGVPVLSDIYSSQRLRCLPRQSVLPENSVPIDAMWFVRWQFLRAAFQFNHYVASNWLSFSCLEKGAMPKLLGKVDAAGPKPTRQLRLDYASQENQRCWRGCE